MSEAPSEPGPDLFASNSPSMPSSSPPPSTPPSKTQTYRRAQNFFIAPPKLPSAQKKLYKPLPETSLKSEVEIDVDEVIGEYSENGRLYYFARYAGGIAHKFPSEPFLQRFEGLVTEYKHKKTGGSLEPFDPSAHYIHPLSRVRMTLSIKKRRATLSTSSGRSTRSGDTEVIPDSQAEDELDDESEENSDSSEDEIEEDEYDDEEDSVQVATRRSHRSLAKPKKDLPFSPKKTRSRRVFAIESDQELTNDDNLPVPRRSSRSKKGVKVNLDAETYRNDTGPSDEDSDDYESRNRQRGKEGKKKKVNRPKASRPVYGRFRAVVDLDYDSDEETAALREHRDICEKCHRGPAHQLINAFSKRPKNKSKRSKKTSEDEFEESVDEEERLNALGGWVRCLKCPVVAHWRCLASTQRDEILKAARDKDRAEWRRLQDTDGGTSLAPEPEKRPGLAAYQTTEFICGACMKGGVCMGCMEIALHPDTSPSALHVISPSQDSDTIMSDANHDATETRPEQTNGDPTNELLFRCFTCKRIAHYSHLPLPPNMSPDDSVTDIAQAYTQAWLCGDCSSYRDGVDKIIAWRPYPANATEPTHLADELPNYKSLLPREYLVKWLDRSYRRLQWVPHMWLVSTHYAKLKNFLAGGSKVELVQVLESAPKNNDEKPTSIFDIGNESRASSSKPGAITPTLPQEATPNAESRIPPAWKTVDRVLDVLLWYPQRQQTARKGSHKKKRARIESDDDEAMAKIQEAIEKEHVLAFDHGEQPSDDLTETVSEWETRNGRKFTLDNIDNVVWAFIKWDDLGYDQATWDSPPRPEDLGYIPFRTAMKRFLNSREVTVPKHSKDYCTKFDNRGKDEYRNHYVLKDASDLDLGQDPALKLMPFQVDGFNWLCNNWWIHQHCILADEMGLGKTVQIATFLGSVVAQFKAFPALVVVPNSTITNWVREFERWAPRLRVVPFYGEAKARDVIKKFELLHEKKRPGETGAKYHVLITTYEALLNPKDFTAVFKNQPRWEVLVIDEGQRLKSDSSLLFKRLNELNSIHRIIMTGTPLNNNIRELFNLMNFLDPEEWRDLEALEKEHEELTEDLVKELHNRLRPYFLRRIKSEVLQLPPKNEVIVPVSMAPLQKEIYRSILSHNLELLNGLTQPSNSKVKGVMPKGRINNVLMQLRKCLQHPYLYAEDIEPRGLAPKETHDKLIDGSAKLRFLKTLLPKLKERGHRVLLFSQFVIALNVIEDFLVGEGHKYLRLDGNTKGSDRQKGMDEFNKPGSDVFIYLLTTRAGGVGINLFSADTVIIFDPDFNPHQDLQAIARAYRFGQQKTCLVFKLMVKDSAEERIMQVGKKKLVLDHLIVQKMDEEDSAGENVQSILTYGAQALFDSDQESRDIIYFDHDIEKLIEKTEKEGEKEEQNKEGEFSFAFAKVWSADKDTLEEVGDQDQGDSWAQTLQKIITERDKIQSQEIALSGRGARRRAAVQSKPNYTEVSLAKAKSSAKNSNTSAEGSAYSGSEIESDGDVSDTTNGAPDDMTFEPSHRKKKGKQQPLDTVNGRPPNVPLSPIHNSTQLDAPLCGLCAKRHGDGPGECVMTEKSEHLAEFREMLLLHADDEPWEERKDAIRAIDNTLFLRGHIHLIAGQPLYPLKKKVSDPVFPTRNGNTNGANSQPNNQQSAHIASAPNTGHLAPESSYPPSAALPLAMQPKPIPYQSSNAIAGPSKRPGSPRLEEPAKKKKKSPPSSLPSSPFCPVCNKSPHHLVKDCPLVTQGSQSISRQIKRLEADPNMARTVRILHKLLSKQTKRELNKDIIDISD